jgi:hypothetical protein
MKVVQAARNTLPMSSFGLIRDLHVLQPKISGYISFVKGVCPVLENKFAFMFDMAIVSLSSYKN